MKNYTDFADLAHVYFEDSYVLAIDETPDSLSFKLDLVLTPSHPRYHEPRADEQLDLSNADSHGSNEST